MKNNPHSQKFLRQRRFLSLLPLLIFPFATILFVILGGGDTAASQPPIKAGLNAELPEASLSSQTPNDKLGYYQNARKDSANLSDQLRSDPYLQVMRSPENLENPISLQTQITTHSDPSLTEQKIQQKLRELDAVIRQPPAAISPALAPAQPEGTAAIESQDLDRLQQMMVQMQSSQQDPELIQLQGLLDKIQQIQNPAPSQPFTNHPGSKPALSYQTIPAVIAKNQKVSHGTVVELRLLDTMTMNGVLIPKGHQVYGMASLSNQRMELRIKSIGLGKLIIPVDLTVIDQRDSMEGIYLPQALTKEAISGGADNAVQGMQVLSMDQTVTTQLAGAGITAAKGLFNKKVKMLKGKISAGYPVLLRNNQQGQSLNP